jgi:hypothetical protein
MYNVRSSHLTATDPLPDLTAANVNAETEQVVADAPRRREPDRRATRSNPPIAQGFVLPTRARMPARLDARNEYEISTLEIDTPSGPGGSIHLISGARHRRRCRHDRPGPDGRGLRPRTSSTLIPTNRQL